MNRQSSTRSWLFGAAAAGIAAALLVAERRRALRKPVQRADGERLVTNLALAGLTTAVTTFAMAPVVNPLAEIVERRRVGLVQRLPIPVWLRDTLAVLLLDYTLYAWHLAEHRVALLYRFHQVHHADLDLDVSTAARFHAGEFLLSIPWRAAQIVVIGVSPRALTTWQRLTSLSVMFHHSNIRLPRDVERVVGWLVVTPRLHGIHHSIVAEEQDSNWSSGLTIWDRVHGTFVDDVPQSEIVIGVPAFQSPRDVTLPKSLAMPLHPLPPWRLPNGERPLRRPARMRPRRVERP